MTPSESNATIAAAMAKDPDEKWREWADESCPPTIDLYSGTPAIDVFRGGSVNCPKCHGTGRIPRDFADPSNTLKLVQWAKGQAWWVDVQARIWDGVILFFLGGLADDEFACAVRDIIAKAAKEAEDD